MKRHFFLIVPIVFALWCAGCAMMDTSQSDPELAAQYVLRAQKLEKQGDLPAALEQYKLAITADPANSNAKENSERLTKKLANLADERYQLGMKYHSRGKYGLARKEFLTALKYQPDHPQASKMLVSREPQKAPSYVFHVVKPGESLSMIAKTYYGDYKKFDTIAKFNHIEDATKVKPGQRIMIPELGGAVIKQESPKGVDSSSSFVEHKLRQGESISKLAQKYYGDYKQFHIIAQFNGMDDATRVKVGQVIKVPKVAGLPFYETDMEDAEQKTSPPQTAMPAEAEKVDPDEELTAQTNGDASPVDEQILAYRETGIELFNESKYEDAVFELNKAIEAAPDDDRTRDYLARAYFESGKQLFDQHDYNAAKEAFESALQYDPKCDQCGAYIEKSKIGPLLMHRSNGLQYFKNNQFNPAIDEFEKFLMNQPQDEEVRLYLSKSYYQQALVDYNKGDFMAAKKGFELAASNDANCEQCADYMEKSVARFKEAHYNKGIVYYNNEKLADAISEWEMVHEIDPGYKDVEHNLSQAKKLLEKLERIKKSNQ